MVYGNWQDKVIFFAIIAISVATSGLIIGAIVIVVYAFLNLMTRKVGNVCCWTIAEIMIMSLALYGAYILLKKWFGFSAKLVERYYLFLIRKYIKDNFDIEKINVGILEDEKGRKTVFSFMNKGKIIIIIPKGSNIEVKETDMFSFGNNPNEMIITLEKDNKKEQKTLLVEEEINL